MEAIKEELGKVAITVEKDYWDIKKAYNRLVIVERKGHYKTYISRVPVPAGVLITNRDFWIPFSSLSEEASAKVTAIYNKLEDIQSYVEEKVEKIPDVTPVILELNRFTGVIAFVIKYYDGVKLLGVYNDTGVNSNIIKIYEDKYIGQENNRNIYQALYLITNNITDSGMKFHVRWEPKEGYRYTDESSSYNVEFVEYTNTSIIRSRGGNPEITTAIITPYDPLFIGNIDGCIYPSMFIKDVTKNLQ